MARRVMGSFLDQVRRLVRPAQEDEPTDGAMLRAFAERQDGEAFATLVRRHGPLVWSVCRRALPDRHEAEDIFQATFLVLVRKADRLHDQGSLASWLYTVAYHLALKTRARLGRGPQLGGPVEMPAADDPGPPLEELALLDEELHRLPPRYREPLVLCYLQGKSHQEAARELGWPSGSMSRHLNRGRELLRERLASRGASLAALPVLSCAILPAAMLEATIQASLAYAAVEGASGTVSAPAQALAEAFLASRGSAMVRGVFLGLLALGALGAVVGQVLRPSAATAPPQPSVPSMAAFIEPARPEDALIDAWEVRPDERRMDRVGWAGHLVDALALAARQGRPVFLYVHEGGMAQGRCDGGPVSMRASGLSNERAIDLLNRYFVPVYVSSGEWQDQATPSPDRVAYQRIYQTLAERKLQLGSQLVIILAPDGSPLSSHGGCHAAQASTLISILESHVCGMALAEGPTLVVPTPQSRPPASGPQDLVLHLVARTLERRGDALVPTAYEPGKDGSSWNTCPAEDWLVLPPEEWQRLLPPARLEIGQEWPIDQAVAERLLRRFYPQTENNDPRRDHLEEAGLHGRIIALREGRVRAEITGRLRLKHPFTIREDDRRVDATIQGSLEFDLNRRLPPVLRLVTPQATYGKGPIGITLCSRPSSAISP